MKWWNKIRRKLIKLRLQPIWVYCMHHVCAEFDDESMNACDWMQIDEFKKKVKAIQQDGVEFISLTDAYKKITHDKIRKSKYAVITFDDGYASLKEILPWLEDQRIPATLFINGKYLDGKSYRNNSKERYLTKDELFALTSSLIEIGSHGWEHNRVNALTEQQFEESVSKNREILLNHPRFIPFWAYTYGLYTEKTDSVVHSSNMIPVYVDKMKNYNDATCIHRDILS